MRGRPTNHLLDALPSRARAQLLKGFTPVDLADGAVLAEPREDFAHVYFPLTALLATVTTVAPHNPLTMSLVGNEGMLGATLLLDVDVAPLRGIVLGGGLALRMPAARFRRELRANPALSRLLKRYLYVLLEQLAQSTACGRFHQVDARLARYLLLTHDRVQADKFVLTHAFLADMLGVRRSAVSIAAGLLQQQGLICYGRGRITILSRAGLERESCVCYADAVETHKRWLG